MNVLIDTSVWIEHLRRSNDNLLELLERDLVLTHSCVIGELSCGNIKNRLSFLSDLKLLPSVTETSTLEILHFVETHRLYAKGLGWSDMQLLASAFMSDVTIWSLDKKIAETARKLGLKHLNA